MEDTNRAFGVADPSLSVGLTDVNFFSSAIPFINVFKQVGGINSDDGSWLFDIPDGMGGFTRLDHSEAFHNGFLDENGYFTTIPDGGITRISLFNDIPADAGIGGRYVFRFEGEGQFSLFGGTIVESEPGRIVIDVADGNSVGITILDVNEDDHLRDFVLVREEHEALHDAGAIFNPDFIAEIQDFRVIRFMDWLGTTDSNIRNFSDFATVDSAFYGLPGNQALETEIAGDLPDFIDDAELATLPRGFVTPVYVDPVTREPLRDADTNELLIYPPDTETLPDAFQVGVPPEIIVALTNQIGADPWINIPHLATDDFVREFAIFLRDNVDPDLDIYVEYSNEVWNPSFDQWHFAREQGLEFFEERRAQGDNFGDQFGDFPSNVYNGIRSIQILTIFHEVFGQDADRIQGVLGSQQVSNFITQEVITGAEYYLDLVDPSLRLDDFVDNVAITGYFGEGVTTLGPVADSLRNLIDRSQQAFLDGETSDQYELFNIEFAEFIRSETLFEGADPVLAQLNDLSLLSLQEDIASHLSVINGNDFLGNATRTAYDFELIQYEGGPNVVPVTTDQELSDFIRQFNRSDEVGELQTDAFEVFRNGGGALASDFHFIETQTFSSTFGTIAFLGDENGLSDDVLSYNANAAQTFGSLEASRSGAFLQGITEVGTTSSESFIGTFEEDFLAGGAGNDTIDSGDGNDGLNGEEGNDLIISADGDDTILGGDGRDTIISGEGRDSILGGQGNDSIAGAFGIDTIDGGLGNDTIVGNQGADSLFGSTGNDSIEGNEGADIIRGGTGADVLNGMTNNDTILGGNGRDTIFGESGADVIFGGGSDDQILSGPGDDTVDGGAGNDNILADNGDDFVDGGGGSDRILGEDGNDTLIGNLGADRLLGGEGNDIIFGSIGNDFLLGSAGNDLLNGGNNNDTLNGSSGFDTLVGGRGDDLLEGALNADVFRFNDDFGNDVIVDFNFSSSFEVIDLRGVSNILGIADLFNNHIMSNAQGDAVIVDGANSITLTGVAVTDLGVDDFIF